MVTFKATVEGNTNVWDLPLRSAGDGLRTSTEHENEANGPTFIPLDSEEAILHLLHRHDDHEDHDPRRLLLLSQPKRERTRTSKTKKRGTEVRLPDSTVPPAILRLGDKVAQDEVESPFGGSLPEIPIRGMEINLKSSKTLRQRNKGRNSSLAEANLNNTQVAKVNDFATSLNWATNENPDGVPLVHPVIDQVS